MKIAYVAQIEADCESGVNKKLASQAGEWCRVGHEVRLFLLTRTAKLWQGWGPVDVTSYAYGGQLQGIRAAQRLVGDLRRWSPDAVYLRQSVCYPAFLDLARSRRLVVEVNTDSDRECRVRMGFLKHIVLLRGQRALISRAIGAVCVESGVGEQLRAEGLDVIVIGNGIDLSRHAPSSAPSNTAPRLLFLGSSGCAWHGVDKLVAVATRFPSWHIDIVGVRQDETRGAWPSNVAFHGFLPQERYRRLIDEADVALGTLALHRIGMVEASPLKVREYLAAGLPVILGHRDTDFPQSAPFILGLPNVEQNIADGLGQIEAFVRRWKDRRVERPAVAHLDVRVKEALRLAYFEKRLVAAGWTARYVRKRAACDVNT